MDSTFLKTLKDADEWDDFELLLRTLKELRAEPLLLSMPLHGVELETLGVSAEARKAYGDRLQELASRYQVEMVYLGQYDNDPTFFADDHDHPGERGWVILNKALDDFYHQRQRNPR
jgi:poly-D-alanine transfer protein DltD